ncbi:MAG TPA: DUF4403 family protein [Xanthobacteraceae bacterium]|nr:DUF4403 family protein [Xanthobacteraceae bacterium]
MTLRAILLGALVVVVSFIGATLLMNLLWPRTASLQQGRPALVAVPPLQPLTGTSTVLTPAAVTMAAIREALDQQAPKNLSGQPQNPVAKLLSNAQLTFNVTRGPFSIAGRSDALIVSTPLTGSFQALGTLAGAAGNGVSAAGSAIGNLIGGNTGQQLQSLAGKAFDQHADISGTIMTASRPTIATNWRLSPNLSSQVSVVDVVLPIGGVKLSVANAVKPALDAAVKEQTNTFEQRLRADPFIETAARSQWVKLCRAVSLGAAAQGMPNLWLEIRPVRAIAAQPLIAPDAVTLLVGVQAQTRIVPSETKPVCPFPQQLDLVPQANQGTVDIAVPIDIPFPEVNRLLAVQITGKTFPEDGSGSFAATIKQAAIAASGDRLLISLLVNIKKRGLFALGADATVHVYGKPLLDQDRQILRFTEVTLDVQSQAAFGLLGAAAQAAVPYLQKTLADKAVIDLKPLATDAKQRIAKAVGDLAGQAPGLSAKAAISDLRLTSVAYDANTLRIIGAAKGNVNVTISSLAGL